MLRKDAHLSTLNSFPPASAMDPSFFITDACLQGWMEAATTEECGNGSTVIVFLACSSLTSSRICRTRHVGTQTVQQFFTVNSRYREYSHVHNNIGILG